MDKKLKNVIAAAVMLFTAAGAAVAVYAYLQKTVEQPNQFTIGEDKVAVSEVFTEPDTMSMTNKIDKEVTVKNEGTSDQFVRVYLDFSDSEVRDKSKILYAKSLDEGVTWSEFLGALPDGWEYVSETDATDGELLGGYFYYTKILKPSEAAPPLINGFSTDFREAGNVDDSNTDRITDFDIIVYNESVQTVDINGTEYSDDEAVINDDAKNWKAAWKSFLSISNT